MILFIGCLLLFFEIIVGANIEFLVIIPAYNNKMWCEKTIQSVLEQDYNNFHLIYIDDASSDGSDEVAFSLLKKYQNNLWTFYKNNENKGALYNYYYAIHNAPDNVVIVMVDGDDWLVNSNVFKRLNKTYQDESIWLTYGQFATTSTFWKSHCGKYPESVIKERSFRYYPWKVGHLRTFYAWLFKKIKIEDLCCQGKFASVAWDLFIMFPLLEMAGERHRFIRDVLYIYNTNNPISDFIIRPSLQTELETYCRSKKQYGQISSVSTEPKV